MEREQKKKFVAELNSSIKDTTMIVVTRNSGLSVAEVTELRRKMRAAGSEFKVTKNKLTHLALRDTPFQNLEGLVVGPTALAWSKDAVAVAKVAVEYAKQNDKFVLIGGSIGNRRLDPVGIKELSELPSIMELRCRIAGIIAGPAIKTAMIVQAPASKLARVFSAYTAKHNDIAEVP